MLAALTLAACGADKLPGGSGSGGTAGGGGAGSPVRVQSFLQEWEPGKKVIPVCQQSYASALAAIAQRLGGG